MIARFMLVGVLAASVLGLDAAAQTAASSETLRRDVERRFDVLPLRDGVALRPRTATAGIRSIELTGGTIAIDGVAVTGSELRMKLGADGDLVIRLSYLDPPQLRTLFDQAAASPTAPPPAPETPSVGVPAVPETPRAPESRGRRRGDRVRFGGSVTVEEDEVVAGDIVSIGGPVTVRGHVGGDVVGIAGGVTLGPRAVVNGDVVSVGGPLRRDPMARIDGDVQEVAWGGDGVPRELFANIWRGMALGATFALFATASRIAVLCLLAALVILLARDHVERIASQAAAEPLKAGVIGFLSQLLFVPLLIVTVVVLIVTIVGIPLLVLLPFAILGLIVLALVGFTAVAMQVGKMVSERAGWNAGPYAMTMIGILVVVSPLLLVRFAALIFPVTFGLGLVGVLVEYLAWTIGFGAVALMRFGKAGGASAPPAVSTGLATS